MKTLDDLTPAEVTRAAAMVAELHEYGYVDRERFNELAPGARVCHRGHRWPEARIDGTGVIVAITEKPDSSWSRSWGMPDVEMVVAWDREAWEGGSRLSSVAQYHVSLVRSDTETHQRQEGSA